MACFPERTDGRDAFAQAKKLGCRVGVSPDTEYLNNLQSPANRDQAGREDDGVMRVYLFRTSDRPYGFTIRAICAKDSESAKLRLTMITRGHVQFDETWRSGYTEIEESFPAKDGEYGTFVFEE